MDREATMKARKSRRDIRGNAGFTLVEVIVIVAVIAIVAGVVAPMLFKQIDEAKVTRAEADCKSISSAILAFRKDLGVWPSYRGTSGNCAPELELLRSGGQTPGGLATSGFKTGVELSLSDVLSTDYQGCYNAQKYKGPYIPAINGDPWGNAYVLAASSFEVENSPVFVYSAGPNGIIDTQITDESPSGDDIMIRVK